MTSRRNLRSILSLFLVSLVVLEGCGKSASEAAPIAPSHSEEPMALGQPNFEKMGRSDRNNLEYTAVRTFSSEAEIKEEVIINNNEDVAVPSKIEIKEPVEEVPSREEKNKQIYGIKRILRSTRNSKTES